MSGSKYVKFSHQAHYYRPRCVCLSVPLSTEHWSSLPGLAPRGYETMATALEVTASRKQVPSTKSRVSLCRSLFTRKENFHQSLHKQNTNPWPGLGHIPMSLLQRRLRNQVPDTFSLQNGVWILVRKRKREEQLGNRRGLPSPPCLEMLGGYWADVMEWDFHWALPCMKTPPFSSTCLMGFAGKGGEALPGLSGKE